MSYVEGKVASITLSKILERAYRNTAQQIAQYNTDNRWNRGDTPIERAFYLALWSEIEFSDHLFTCIYSELPGQRYNWNRVTDEVPMVVECQVHVLDWPVDFLISIVDLNGSRHSLVVECDGHDFHERSKEQAKRDRGRDRRIQAAGLTIFRFTGSEIFSDPCRCADAVLSWAADRLCLFGSGAK